MHIHDFYSKLTSVNEDSGLFQALRTLSQVEDPKHVLSAEGGTTLSEWAAWPAMEQSAASLAAV
jgi:hypothetical protein